MSLFFRRILSICIFIIAYSANHSHAKETPGSSAPESSSTASIPKTSTTKPSNLKPSNVKPSTSNPSINSTTTKTLNDEPTKDLHFVVGFSLAPYILQNARGLVGEIIQTALETTPYRAQFEYRSNAEALEQFENGHADAMALTKEGLSSGYYSNSVIKFNNVAVALAKNKFKINQIADMQHYSVAGFSKAERYLGDDFRNMAEQNPLYREIPRQKDQVRALFLDQVDIIISDRLIFQFNKKLLRNEHTYDKTYRQEVQFFPLFNTTPYYVVFKDKGIAEAFNEGLSKAIANGKINKLHRKYNELLELH